ncbi:MAG: caspase family protein [Cyclobacteriaceae bacterium]
MKSLFLSFFTFFFLSVNAQELIDVSGEWNGNSNFLRVNYQVTSVISQKGSQLTGYSISKSMNGKDSSRVEFNGVVEGDVVKLFPVKFTYKTGTACLANSVLKFALDGDQYSLIGRWKGDIRLKTCPTGVSGGLKLYKTASKQVTVERKEGAPTNTISTVLETDDVGNALVNELSKRKYYALIIGVEEYPDEEIQELDNPINDATALAEVLTANYSFEKSEMIILKNPGRGEIIEALDNLSRKVTDKDNLFIFYAGHGIWNEQLNQGYWLPADASMNSKSNWLSNSTIRDYLGGIKSKHTLLVSDACFSGGILKERAVFENSRAILELYKLPSRKAMTSGTLKTVPDKSVFIEYLIKNLQDNQAPLLSADQLFRTFKIAVINNSPNGQVPQYGPIFQAGDEGGDFIFLKREK